GPALSPVHSGLPDLLLERMIERVEDPTAQRPAPYARRPTVEPSTTWPQFVPPVELSTGPLRVVQTLDREIARLTALRARAVAEFAGARPASADRAQGEPGAMSPQRWAARPELLRPVSEWAAQEASIGLTCSRRKAEDWIAQALMLARLPRLLAALEGGLLTLGHVWCFE